MTSFMGMVYATLKAEGIDTSEMTPTEAVEKFNELSGKKILRKEEIANAKQLTGKQNSVIYKGSKQKLKNLIGKEQATYDLETGERIEHASGFQVAFQQTTDEYTDDEYDAKVNEVAKQTGSRAQAGVYGEPEVSFRVDDLDKAMEIAEKYNQISIWDWKEMREIKNKKYNPNKGNN